MTLVSAAPSPSVPAPRPSVHAPSPSVPAPRARRRPRLRAPAHEPDPVPPGTVQARLALPIEFPGPGTTTLAPCRETGPAPRPPAERPDDGGDVVRLRASALVRTMIEVLAGRRPPGHLAGTARPEVVRYVAASRPATPSGAGPAPGLRSVTGPRRVHVFRPGPDAAEIVAVCRFGPRFRALAIRMDRDPAPDRDAAWYATAVRLL